jgi:hypothetical protein
LYRKRQATHVRYRIFSGGRIRGRSPFEDHLPPETSCVPDLFLENTVSVTAPEALGFEESSRDVRLSKRLTGATGKTVERSMATQQRTLILLDGTFAVCRLEADALIPSWATAGGFFSITRTDEELSIVCRQDLVPQGVVCERDWCCLRVAGTIPFAVVGVLASLTAPLAAAGISVFAVSTFDTDYLLMRGEDLPKAIGVLRGQGHAV